MPPNYANDNSESLVRRKFLRQNRDIARINSTQSLRIRSLENECSRLLSENLDLRGQIVRLEKELEDNSSQRIADHALDIKARMEAQLVEWGALLAGLGLEPPLKRRSPRGRRMANPRPDRNQSPAQRRTRDVTKDLVALALQDGRLPSISENKPYPRATMKYVCRDSNGVPSAHTDIFVVVKRSWPCAPRLRTRRTLPISAPRQYLDLLMKI